MQGILEALREAEANGFRELDRDALYAQLGISMAGEVAEADLKPQSAAARKELIRVVLELGRCALPPVYPADEKYAAFIEGVELTGSVTDLRAKLGYPHFHTRDSVLARLRGYMFHSLLEHFDSYQETHPGGEGFAESFLVQVAAKRLKEWRERVKDIMFFSRHEEWDDARQTRFADQVLEEFLRWFLSDPHAFLDSPDRPEAWRRFLWSSPAASYATRFFAAPFHHLRILKASELAKKKASRDAAAEPETVDGGAGPVQSSRELLVESSWYRHFFFDERGITRWVRYGTIGLENEETFDDFISKLEARPGWRRVVSPDGIALQGVDEVRQRRILGAYRVEWKSETQVVSVKAIPTLDFKELKEFVEAPPDSPDVLDLDRGWWLFRLAAGDDDGPQNLVVRSAAHGWSEVVRPYRMAGFTVGVVKLPGAGRYLVSKPGSLDPLVEFSEARESRPVLDFAFLVHESAVRATVRADRILEGPPSGPAKTVTMTHLEKGYKTEWSVRLLEPTVGLYRLEASIELPLDAAGLGGTVTASSPLLKEGLSAVLPTLGLLRHSTEGWGLLPDVATVGAADMSRLVVLGTPPLEVLLPDGQSVAKVLPGRATTSAVEGAEVRLANSGVLTSLEISEGEGALLQELVFRSREKAVRLLRRREIHVAVDPALGGSGTRWVVYSGAPVTLRVEIRPVADDPILVRLEGPSGARDTRQVASGAAIPISEDFLGSGTVLLSAGSRDCAPVEAEVVAVGRPMVEAPAFLEAGAIGEGLRVSCSSFFYIKAVRGDIFQWTCQPRPARATKESLVMVRPYRTRDATCHLQIECAYEGVAEAAGPVFLDVQVPLAWIEFRHRGERVDAWDIQAYRGDPVSAILRTPVESIKAFALCAGKQVELSRSPAASPNLAASFSLRGLREPAEISFLLRDARGVEHAIGRRARISPHYAPRVALPDGLAWHPGMEYAVLVDEARPGLKVSVEDAAHSVTAFEVVDGVAKVSCRRLPGNLYLQNGSKTRVRMYFDQERDSLTIRESERPSATFFLAPDSLGGFSQVSPPLADFPKGTTVLAMARSSAVLCIEVPSLLMAVDLLSAGSGSGWAVSGSESLRAFLGLAPIEVASLDRGPPPPGTIPNAILVLDSEDAPSWESFLPARGEHTIAVVPSGSLSVRADASAALRILGEAIQAGRLSEPHDSSAWRRVVGDRGAADLARATMENGLEDVLAQAAAAALLGPPEALLRDAKGCENLGRLMGYPHMLSRISPEHRAALHAALLSIGRFVLSDKASTNFEKDATAFHTLVAGWDGTSSPDPRDGLLTEEYSAVWDLVRKGKWEPAVGLMRRIIPMFGDRPWIRWDYPGLILEAKVAGYGSYDDLRQAVMQLERLRKEKVPGLERSPFRGKIETILWQRHCPECGGIILMTGRCINCKALYPPPE